MKLKMKIKALGWRKNKVTGEMESVSRNAGCDTRHSTEEGDLTLAGSSWQQK